MNIDKPPCKGGLFVRLRPAPSLIRDAVERIALGGSRWRRKRPFESGARHLLDEPAGACYRFSELTARPVRAFSKGAGGRAHDSCEVTRSSH